MANESSSIITRQLKIKPIASDDLPLVFINHVVIQGTPTDVVLSLFQISPPLVETPEELNRMDAIPARCVARFVFTHQHAVELHRSLGESLHAIPKNPKGK